MPPPWRIIRPEGASLAVGRPPAALGSARDLLLPKEEVSRRGDPFEVVSREVSGNHRRLVERLAMRITQRAQVHVPRPIEEVFDFSVACETFPRVLHPLGPIAGVAKAEMIDAPAPRTGARRRVHMTDGSEIEEVLVTFDRPTRHRYRWLDRPAPPFSWLVRVGEGDWTFAPSDGGTSIVWVYSFELTTPLAYPFAAPVGLLFRRWMMRGLLRIRAVLAP